MVQELRIHTPDGGVRTVLLEGQPVRLGRSTANELCYPDDTGLSRNHMIFEQVGSDWIVRDLGSKNGTLVNGARITGSHRLRPGDRVTAGHLLLRYADPFSGGEDTVMFVDAETNPTTSSTIMVNLQNALSADTGSVAASDGLRRMEALLRAGRELSGHRPLAELFEVILDLAVEVLGASRGVLMTLERDELIVRAARGEGFRISSTVRDRILKEKASLLVRDTQSDDDFRERLSIVEHKVRSMLAAPLQTDERVIGLIYLDSASIVREFTREDLNLLTVMGNIAAIRLEHARLAEVEQAERILARDLEQAAEIQRRLLPAGAPSVPGFDLAGYNAPCRTVGGDYYDFPVLADGRVALIIGDVAGKGMPAALLMSSLQARVQVLIENEHRAAELIEHLNRTISANCPANRFISFFVGVLDPRSGELDYCNAGHNPPLLVRRNGATDRLEGGGVILGIMPAARYQTHRCRLEPGDVLVLFSDGLTEATPPDSDEEFGEDRVSRLVFELRTQPARVLVDSLNKAVMEWIAGTPPADDITLVVARRRE